MAGVQAGNGVAGQTGGGGDHQTIGVNNLMGDLSDSMKEKLKSLDDALIENTAGDGEQTKKAKIPRAPKKLRDKEKMKKFFEPRVVSIGPYHHQNQNLEVKEDMKRKLAAMFIKEHGVNKEDAFRTIRMEIKDLKEWYEADATGGYSDDELAWMFPIDGCVVLHFIYIMKYGYDKSSGKFKGLEILLAAADRLTFQMDMMLLENQLPYQLLHSLIQSSTKEEGHREQLKQSIRHFIRRRAWDQPAAENPGLELERPDTHLLDFFRRTLIFVEPNNSVLDCNCIIDMSFKIVGMPFRTLMCIIGYLLHIIRPHKRTLSVVTLRNVEDLQQAGVELKLNTSGSLTDVKFDRGTLHLPAIVVNDATAFKFFNLIAYEICTDSYNEPEVCFYILFLALLINRSQDVKELRGKRILYNHLESDEKVVELFQDIINIDDLRVPFKHKYHRTLEEIEDYYNNRKYHVWMAQLKTRYFESPWSVVALSGAIIALVLTFLQTWYTILGYQKG